MKKNTQKATSTYFFTDLSWNVVIVLRLLTATAAPAGVASPLDAPRTAATPDLTILADMDIIYCCSYRCGLLDTLRVRGDGESPKQDGNGGSITITNNTGLRRVLDLPAIYLRFPPGLKSTVSGV